MEDFGFEVDVLVDMVDFYEVEVFFWVGCGGVFVEWNRFIVQVIVMLFKKVGVKFVIFGCEESCIGDFVCCIGNEFMFEMMV